MGDVDNHIFRTRIKSGQDEIVIRIGVTIPVIMGVLFGFLLGISDGESKGLCPQWGTAQRVFGLDWAKMNEVSGMAVSQDHSRIYYVNDSGSGPFVYATNRNGLLLGKITISDSFFQLDNEELAMGVCPLDPNKNSCLVVGDIGDNFEFRNSIEIIFLPEPKTIPMNVNPILRLSLSYPDRAHNAEAFALLPNGDIVLITKEKIGRASVYRYQMKNLNSERAQSGVLEKMGEIDISTIVESSEQAAITGMSISRDGSKMILLTYSLAIEWQLNWDQGTMFSLIPNQVQKIPIKILPQMEAVAFDDSDQSFFYTTEAENLKSLELVGGKDVPVYKVVCQPDSTRD